MAPLILERVDQDHERLLAYARLGGMQRWLNLLERLVPGQEPGIVQPGGHILMGLGQRPACLLLALKARKPRDDFRRHDALIAKTALASGIDGQPQFRRESPEPDVIPANRPRIVGKKLQNLLNSEPTHHLRKAERLPTPVPQG